MFKGKRVRLHGTLISYSAVKLPSGFFGELSFECPHCKKTVTKKLKTWLKIKGIRGSNIYREDIVQECPECGNECAL